MATGDVLLIFVLIVTSPVDEIRLLFSVVVAAFRVTGPFISGIVSVKFDAFPVFPTTSPPIFTMDNPEKFKLGLVVKLAPDDWSVKIPLVSMVITPSAAMSFEVIVTLAVLLVTAVAGFAPKKMPGESAPTLSKSKLILDAFKLIAPDGDSKYVAPEPAAVLNPSPAPVAVVLFAVTVIPPAPVATKVPPHNEIGT